MSLGEDLATFLIGRGVGTALGSDVFINKRPDQPDEVLVLTEYAGTPGGSGDSSLTRRFQVLYRSEDPDVASAKSWEVFNILNNPDNPELHLSDTRWTLTRPTQTPFKLMEDSRERVSWVFNVSLITFSD